MLKKIRDSKWALAIIPTILGTLLTLVVDVIKKADIFSTLKSVFFALWRCIINFLTFEVKVWWIIITLILLFLVLWIAVKIADKKELSKPEWMKYTEDHFVDWKWSWKWEKNYLGSYQVSNLVAHCPKCDTPMRHDDYDTAFHCPRCKFESRRHSDNRNDIMVVIYDNADKMDRRHNS